MTMDFEPRIPLLPIWKTGQDLAMQLPDPFSLMDPGMVWPTNLEAMEKAMPMEKAMSMELSEAHIAFIYPSCTPSTHLKAGQLLRNRC